MSTTIPSEVNEGLEGLVAFATEIAEPDRAGGALRYRGVDVEELVGRVPFEQVWGLLVDGAPRPGLGAAGDVTWAPGAAAASRLDARRELQAAIARLPMRPLIDLDPDQARDELARASAATLELAADIARAVAPARNGATGTRAGNGTAARSVAERRRTARQPATTPWRHGTRARGRATHAGAQRHGGARRRRPRRGARRRHRRRALPRALAR